MTKLFILLANVMLPVTAIVLSLLFPDVTFRWMFVLSITGHVCIRMWETFYTSKEQKPQKFEGDWTLAVGTLAYISMLFLVTFEFYCYRSGFSFFSFIVGILAYVLASRLRWWGAKTLGSQWGIHVIGKRKTEKTRLVHIGPYAYIRHPVYLGILIEELSVPLIANAFFSLFFVGAVNIPLLLVRLWLEERVSEAKFRRFSYDAYRKETGVFIPKSRGAEFLQDLMHVPSRK